MVSIAKYYDIRPYLTYSGLYPSKPSLENQNIIKYTKSQHGEELFWELSSLNRASRNMNKALKKEFYSFYKPDEVIQTSFLNKKIEGYFTVGIAQLEQIISWLFTNQSNASPDRIMEKLNNLFESGQSINDFFFYNGIEMPDVRYLDDRKHFIMDITKEIALEATDEIMSSLNTGKDQQL